MNKRHYEHTLPNIRGSLSNTYIQAIPGNLKKILLPFLLFQEERTAIQTTAFQTVFVVAPIKDMQPATGAVGKNMTALL